MSSTTPHHKANVNDETAKKVGDRFIIKPQALDVVWGSDERYWRLPKGNSSDPAELLQVSWLEVKGTLKGSKLNQLDRDKEYTANFKLRMKPDAFGWADSPVYFMAKPGKEHRYMWTKADLRSREPGKDFRVPTPKFRIPDKFDDDDVLLFGVYEIWKGRWKGGLVIYEVVIEPVG